MSSDVAPLLDTLQPVVHVALAALLQVRGGDAGLEPDALGRGPVDPPDAQRQRGGEAAAIGIQDRALHHQLQRAVEEVVNELGSELVVLGVRRYELPRLPRVVLREAVANPSELEQALSTVAHIFSDSEAEYAKSLDAAAELGHFLDAADEYQRASSYIAAAEFSDDSEIEKIRTALIASLDMALLEPSETRNREVGYLWERFQRAYSENFVTRHDSVMRSHDLQEKFDEICRSDVWREYQELSDLPIFSRVGARTAAALTKRLEELDCKFEVRRAIAEQPTCICSFRLGSEPEWRDLPSELWGTVSRALERFRVFLARPHNPVLPALGAIAEGTPNSEKAVAARELIEMFQSDQPIPRFSMDQVLVLRSVILELGLGTEAAADPTAESPFHLLDGLDAETIVEDAVIVEI